MSVDQYWQVIRPARKLTGRRSFFVIPTFSYNSVTWKGASEVVTQFNYTVDRNFVLPRTVNPPVDPNFVACIRWHDEDGNVRRYKLWQNVGEVLNVSLIRPSNVIGNNFTVEIWNIETDTSSSLAEEIEVRTSLKTAIRSVNEITDIEEDAGIEYPRSQLVNTNIISHVYTNISDIATAYGMTLLGWYKLDSVADYTLNGGNVSQWNDSSPKLRHLVQASPANQPIFNANGFGTKNLASIKFVGTDNLNANFGAIGQYNTIYALIKVHVHPIGAFSRLIGTGSNTRLELSSTVEGKFKYVTGPSSIEDYFVGPEQMFLARMTYSVAGGGPNWTFMGSNGPILTDINSATYDIAVGSVPVAPISFTLGLSTNDPAVSFELGEIVVLGEAIATAYADADQAIRRYFANKFENLIEIPLTFGAGAVGTPTT